MSRDPLGLVIHAESQAASQASQTLIDAMRHNLVPPGWVQVDSRVAQAAIPVLDAAGNPLTAESRAAAFKDKPRAPYNYDAPDPHYRDDLPDSIPEPDFTVADRYLPKTFRVTAVYQALLPHEDKTKMRRLSLQEIQALNAQKVETKRHHSIDRTLLLWKP